MYSIGTRVKLKKNKYQPGQTTVPAGTVGKVVNTMSGGWLILETDSEEYKTVACQIEEVEVI